MMESGIRPEIKHGVTETGSYRSFIDKTGIHDILHVNRCSGTLRFGS